MPFADEASDVIWTLPCSSTSEAAFSVRPLSTLKITYLFYNQHPLLVHLQFNVSQTATSWSTSTTGSRMIPILIHVSCNLRSTFYGTTSPLLLPEIQQVAVLLRPQILLPTVCCKEPQSKIPKSGGRLQSPPSPTPSSVNAKSEQ